MNTVLTGIARSTIRGAVARGYCHEPNATKILDPVLCESITDEVISLLATEDPPPTSAQIAAKSSAELNQQGPTAPSPPTFREELAAVINLHSRESGSNTPDHILAEYMEQCLYAFEAATVAREGYYGHSHGPSLRPVFGGLGLGAGSARPR